jgi:hypothetical protein
MTAIERRVRQSTEKYAFDGISIPPSVVNDLLIGRAKLLSYQRPGVGTLADCSNSAEPPSRPSGDMEWPLISNRPRWTFASNRARRTLGCAREGAFLPPGRDSAGPRR